MIDTLNSQQNDLLVAAERFELVAKATHDVIWDWDLENDTVWWNEGMVQIFGHTPQTLEPGSESWHNNIHPEDQERVVKKIHDIIDSGGTKWSDYYRFRKGDGTYAHVHDRGYTIQKDGKPVRMLGSMMDITEQLRLEEARRESEENLKFALHAADLGTWNFDPATQKIVANERCKELYGNPDEEEFEFGQVIKYIHPDDLQKVSEAVSDALDPQVRAPYEVRYRTIGAKDNVLRWLHCKGQAYFTPEGVPYRFAGITREITEEVIRQEKISWADKQAAMSIEGSGAGSFLVDPDTDEIIYSPTMARILTGNENRHITRSVFIDHVHPEDIRIREEAYEVAAKTGELRYEARFIWVDKSVHWVRVIGQYLFDSNGKPATLSGIVMDISDRIDSELRLRTSEEHLRTLIAQAPVATTLFVGPEFIIDLPNAAMLKLWGKGDTVIGKPLSEALPELKGQPFLDILERIYRTGEAHSEQGARGEIVVDGILQTFYYDYTYKPLRNTDGEIYAILDMAVDVTEQVKSRQALEKSEERYRQLASELEGRVQQRTAELNQTNAELINSNNNLQQFAYAASHDMQEPLRKIQSFGSRLQMLYAKELDENGAFMLNRIQDASKRMSVMIDDLLAYSRLTTRDAEMTAVNLKGIVSNVLADLEISIQEHETEIVVNEMPEVHGNALQLTQLLQNLVSNAIKYRKTDVPSRIELSYRDATEAELSTIPKLLEDHGYIRLEVSDNGIGFDETHLDRIFQMFQRLHGRSEFSGSGIGLALCKKVAQNHHGYITATSTVGAGSTFIVFLPKSSKK
ncbi:PAS domain-containing protein [Dyadobacter sp. Leaf189]|uniref:PAS domain-containing sensor histidine kinase n=1 Tax=Dyadobacter sp. Leaf189 TaxID=1736295 RepID=UPI0006FC346B|nr:PAS domain-containing protein [Dyadobacter sp. Leaf189]KQS26847.1 PAS domain-containing sensor histidine kinase [Dyadobacter sp. Leaf189]